MNKKKHTRAPVIKVEVACPHCNKMQKESPHAKSTFCLSCGKHFEIVDSEAVAPPDFFSKPEVQSSKIADLFSDLATFFGAKPKFRDIRCFQCAHRQTVSSAATSTICPKCSSYIELQSYKISTPFSRALRTQGEIIITASGDLNSSKAYCSSALVQGNLRGDLHCSGTVRIKRKGRILGNIEAEKIIIERKSVLEFARTLKVHDLEILGNLEANVIATGTVKILSKGWLKGEITALGFKVDKGGEFHGNLTIGNQTLKQTELLPRDEPKPPDELPRLADSGHQVKAANPAS